MNPTQNLQDNQKIQNDTDRCHLSRAFLERRENGAEVLPERDLNGIFHVQIRNLADWSYVDIDINYTRTVWKRVREEFIRMGE